MAGNLILVETADLGGPGATMVVVVEFGILGVPDIFHAVCLGRLYAGPSGC